MFSWETNRAESPLFSAQGLIEFLSLFLDHFSATARAKDSSLPENYFAKVEQSAFNPANVVPGIGFSPDKMLQGRLSSYGDAQRYRLGVNHHQIPLKTPRCPYHSFHRDGSMRVDGNYGSTLGYEPNSYGEWQQQPGFAEPPLHSATHRGRFRFATSAIV
jgi:catalase